MSNNSQQLPSIKISYSGSGVRFLRILGWINIGIFGLGCILWASGVLEFFGFGEMFDIVGFIAVMSLLALLFFAGACFALATIAENALMSKAVLESKYDFAKVEYR